jgi:hypothetical protein
LSNIQLDLYSLRNKIDYVSQPMKIMTEFREKWPLVFTKYYKGVSIDKSHRRFFYLSPLSILT